MIYKPKEKMMSLMSKLLMSSLAATCMLSAGAFNVEKFVKKNVVKNPKVKIKNIQTINIKKIPGKNDWNAYLIMVNLTFNGKKIKEPMTIFVDEKSGLATMSLMDANNGTEYQKVIKPDMPESYYNDEHLIAGDKNAKHKMVIFSDPQCPFCIQYVPKVLKDFKEKKGDVALYYYHMPLLRLHPVSEVLTRVMESLQKEGKTDQAMKVYGLKIAAREKKEEKILAALKKQLGIEVNKEKIASKEIKEAVKKDMDAGLNMMIRGTPTVYFDGEYDQNRAKYKQYMK